VKNDQPFDGEEMIVRQNPEHGVGAWQVYCCRAVTAQSSTLKPVDPAALQTMVDPTAKELLIPGAVVFLRTPQGEFVVTYGTTLLGAKSPPAADT
jgi:hypothetical protein